MASSVHPPKICPPFSLETARAKVKAAENAWNSRDPERVALAYTQDSTWRNRTEFFVGREAIKDFLRRKWSKELDYRLMKELWCYTDNRIAVRFEYEWHDENGQWYRTHGNEMWEFDEEGLMKRRDMSANGVGMPDRTPCDHELMNGTPKRFAFAEFAQIRKLLLSLLQHFVQAS